MIAIKKLTKRYPGNKEDTIQDIDLTLPDTGLFFLIGKSGAGKSTFLSILGGMDFDYRGMVLVDGRSLKELNAKEREDYRFEKIAFVFQDGKAEDYETLEENLLKPLAITDLTSEEKKKRIGDALKRVGLDKRLRSRFKDLSGGEKKRVSLARALIRDCPILLLDEPMASLDPRMRKRVLAILKKESLSRLVLVITHEEKEIPRESGILSLKDGQMTWVQKAEKEKSRKRTFSYARKNFSGLPFLRSLLVSLRGRRAFLIVTIASLVISLFSISFSFLLSGSVKEAMTSSLSQYMDKGAMVVDCKEDYNATGYDLLGYNDLRVIERSFPEFVVSVSPFYLTSLNTIFMDDQRISLTYQDRYLTLDSLSLDSFLQFSLPEESPVKNDIAVDLSEVGHEEVILVLDENSLSALYLLLFREVAPYGMTEETLLSIRKRIWYEGLTLRIEANQGEWAYDLDHSYQVEDVLMDEKSYLISPKNDFSEYFVSETMQFVEVMEGDEKTFPWSVEKCYGLTLYPDRTSDFLRAFLHDERFDSTTLSVLKKEPYYVEENVSTHNRLQVYEDYLPRISLTAIERFVKDHEPLVESVSYSSPVYTYTASGFISGFQKPFFFSRDKEKLNAIMDKAYTTEENLGAFQGSLIEVEEGVLKADLLSAMEEEGLHFLSLDHSGREPLYGQKPTSMEEIAISSALAETLFGDISSALGEVLHCLTLDRTYSYKEKYRNVFSEGKLSIVGIYEGEENAILQDSLFPLCYAFGHTSLGPEDLRIDQAVIEIDPEKVESQEMEKAISRYGNYKASFPMLAMTEDIGEMMDVLSALFLSFAVLSLLTASFLLFLALYLIVGKDRRSIGILLSLGYDRREISLFYASMFFVVGFLSYLLSLALTLFAEGTLRKTLTGLLAGYGLDLFPYLVSLSTIVLVCGILSFVLSFSIRKLSPKDAFGR